MQYQSRLIVTLVLSTVAMQGCANADVIKPVTPIVVEKPSAQTIVEKPANPAIIEAHVVGKQTTPVVVIVKAPDPIAVIANATTEHYTVIAGDTLAKVAARKEVYGNAKLWPLLYRTNSDTIGVQGLIYPGQVLTISRNYTTDDENAIINRHKHKHNKVATAQQSTPVHETAAVAVPVKPTTQERTASKPANNDATHVAIAIVEPATSESAAPVNFVAAARRAFAAGDIPWSVYYYNVHLSQHINDVRAWGELGNVYYFDGDLAQSAQAYFNAANIMIVHGNLKGAEELLPAIDEGNAVLAQALYSRLTNQ